mmetsp:Transcript_17028/g.34488  ORF Transcript_17028/g.34488 Transcript_17028/m.34488 type:complete len:242 (-) Transcript_17028:116-841(-)|eukprot:CAMPEP_0167775490 /NCGR_PEP_ID=MMETSP0111_2-20121227/2593_1 /TAXON_ID=91324 /ORGANISM="Lotharella globosa, Strain CCCM811" /LENGTH=241 /DNA_ID=CAMNT_0007665421 /DNA_START=23 /DNA_END=748 /DNA_ORIENTATION=-
MSLGGEWKGNSIEEENAALREENEKLKAEKDAAALSIHRVMRMINIGNAVLLCFTGIWNIITNVTLQPLVYIFGLYIIVFSCCLGCFEFRCPMDICTRWFMKNMGFLFSWRGRLIFYLFMASLVMGMGLVGLVIGIATVANSILNIAVICKYPEYFEMIKKESEEMVEGALEAEIRDQVAAAAAGYAMKEVKRSAHAMMGMDEVHEMVEEGNEGNDFGAADFDNQPIYGRKNDPNEKSSFL